MGCGVGLGNLAHYRGHIDEHARTLGLHVRQGSPGPVDIAVHVDVEHPLEVLKRNLRQPAENGHGCIVYPGVEPPELLHGSGGQGLHSLGIRHVRGNGDCIPAPLTAFLGQRLQHFFPARSQNEADAFVCQVQRGGTANAARRTGDDDNAVLESHGLPHPSAESIQTSGPQKQ